MRHEAMFQIRDLGFAYDGRSVLRVPSLDIDSGETLALVGPNGSGKTTLLKILNNLLKPSSGTVLFLGQPAADNPELRARSVYVHQSPYLLAGSVYRNLSFALGVRRVPKEEVRSRVAQALELLGLSGFERRDAKRLSGGETQRVAIARALVLKPDILFLDEPTAQTDKASGERIASVLASLSAERGVTVVLSSHDAAFAQAVSDRAAFLEEGLLSRVEKIDRRKAQSASVYPSLEYHHAAPG